MYKEIIRPTLDLLDRTNILPSEEAHILARELLHLAEQSPATLAILERIFAYKGRRLVDERLRVTVGGVRLENPVIIGAGWDKVGRSVKAWHTLGAAATEVGAVLAIDQYGNPKKRQFMLNPGVSLNRLGFNSPGMHTVIKNVEAYQGAGIPIGFNLGINKEITPQQAPTMYAIVVKALRPYATFFTINVSSPNTPGLRSLQDKGPLTDIVQAVNSAMDEAGGRVPTFIKIAPELTFEATDDVIDVAMQNGLAGIVCTNTTTNPGIKANYGEMWRNEAGGLAGNDPNFRRMATERVAHVFKQAGDRLDIMGVGGVNSTATALEKIMAGAKAVQVVTGIREVGTTLPGRINHGLAEWMDREGVRSLSELVGLKASKY